MLSILLLVGAALVQAAEFNSSVTVTVDAWSPMLNFWPVYKIHDNGTAQRNLSAEGDPYFNWYFIGTDYKTKGTLQPSPDSTESALARNQQLGTDPLRTIFLGPSEVNTTGLGSISGLPLGAYTISFYAFGNTSVTFESMSYSIPVLTQAPSFEEMKSQTHRVIGSVNGSNELSQGFSAHPRRSQKYLEQARSQSPYDTLPNATASWTNSNNGALLEKATELTFEVPANTTLVKVTASVGVGDSCYAVLEPMPYWWNLKSVPMAVQNKPSVRLDEQTMFVLPTDPTVKYNLTVGGFGNTTKCHVGGVTSYSFFYEAPPEKAAPANTTEATGEDTGAATANSSSGGNSKKKDVGAIVGGVVGGVCGLLLLILALWLLRRRRKSEDASDDNQNGHPTVTAYSPPTTVSTQNSFVKGSPFNSSDSPPLLDATSPSTSDGPRAQRNRPGTPEIEYARDYEDVSNPPGRLVLPPRYREAWGGRDAAEVSPAEASDEAPILRDSNGRTTQLKRDMISIVDAKREMSTV